MHVRISCRDPNPHELLVHTVAEQAGFYRQVGLEVEVIDLTGEPTTEPPFSFGLGGSVLERLLHGRPWKIVSVNTDRPLFWLFAREASNLSDLRGCRVVGGAPASAPMIYLRLALTKLGLNVADDLQFSSIPPGRGADAARRDAIRQGRAEAAFLGSQIPPDLLRAEGFVQLLYLGDLFRVPTTGIAVDTAEVSLEAPEVTGLVAAQVRALRRIRTDPDLTIAALTEIFAESSPQAAHRFYSEYIRPFFTVDGLPDRAAAEQALLEVGRLLGVSDVPIFEDVYVTEFADRHFREIE